MIKDTFTAREVAVLIENLDKKFSVVAEGVMLLSQQMGRVEQKLSAVEERLTAVEERLVAIEIRMTRLEARVTSLEGRTSRIEDILRSVLIPLEKRVSGFETRFGI